MKISQLDGGYRRSDDFIDSEVGTRIGERAGAYSFPNATDAELQAMCDYRSPSLSWLLDS